jgi:hypothetical protein
MALALTHPTHLIDQTFWIAVVVGPCSSTRDGDQGVPVIEDRACRAILDVISSFYIGEEK